MMTVMCFRFCQRLRAALVCAVALGVTVGPSHLCHAAAQSFVARADRTQVPLDDSFLFEVTLVLDEGRAQGYRAPNFKDFRVLGEHPSQSTQIQMGGGGTLMQVVYSWRYEVMPLKTGTFKIGPAKVRIGDRDIETTPVSITVTEAMGGQAAAPQPRQVPAIPGFPRGLRDMLEPRRAPPSSGGQNFVRVVPSKTKAYVGEQITAEWYLYLTERQDKYETLKEPHTDGFWVEDLPIAGNERGLSLSQQTFEGRAYLVAPLLRRALFPLRSGTLTIVPLEAEISQIDFFGSTMRTERIKAAPLDIEVMPLPKTGQPANFDRAAVGTFSIAAVLDKARVPVGEPVTLKLLVSGQGNVRKLVPPEPPRLEGFKAYEPKVTFEVNPGEPVSGSKTVEVLLLAQKPGTFTVPSVALAYFDPSKGTYATAKTEALTVTVVGEENAAPTASAPPSTSGNDAATRTENVLPTELRPIRSKPTLRRDLGTTLYRSPWFMWLLLLPPAAFGLLLTTSQVRQRLLQDTERRRGRRMRRQVRKSLTVAERHLAAGRKAEFFIEIDRTLRELLSAKLGRVVSGLSMDELRTKLAEAGLDQALANRVTAMLEECDQARFAPGSVSDDGMTTALDRAGELIVQLERSRMTKQEAAR
ncbi:MAG: BatD family protein [Deltaproteobacteria bacterium]|nr:BatD family protein [Deltaproteobacteria bacterium]